jgi:hypothetical protein
MYFVVATKRSGHHAFIEWLYQSIAGPKVYFNNCNLSIASEGISYAKVVKEGVRIAEDRFVHFDTLSGLSAKLLASSENKTLEWFRERVIENEDFSSLGKIESIIFLRDPFNSFASLCKLVERKPEKFHQLDQFISSWMSLASQFMKEGAALSTANIFYNDFVKSESYRNHWSDYFGLQCRGLNSDLSTFGGGGNTMFGKPKEYAIDTQILESRWQQLDDMSIFRRILSEDFLCIAEQFCKFVDRQDLFDEPFNKVIRNG